MTYFSLENWWVILLSVIVTVIPLLLLSYRLLQGWQLSSYKIARFFKWTRDTRSKLLLRLAIISIMSIIVSLMLNSLFYSIFKDIVIIIDGAFALLFSAIFLFAEGKVKKKTPLKFTRRIIRLYVVLTLIISSYAILSLYLMNIGWYYIYGLMFMLSFVLLPAFIYLAIFITQPFEMLNNYRYIKSAKNKIVKSKAKVVAITGSCGKTTIKNFIYELLKTKYNVASSRDSYNTPLGVSRTVREQLNCDTEILVLEMGARNIGDIKYLTGIAQPDIAVLTEIAPQHLEYFKSIENIKRAKYEIIDGLKSDGIAVFGSESTRELFNQCDKHKFIAADLVVDNLSQTSNGLTFNFAEREYHLDMIGEHNVINFLVAVLVARAIGMTDEEIFAASKNIKGQAHRLELIKCANNITVIDDTYNSNPTSASSAIDTVSQLNGRKIIVTAGFIEQGDNAKNAHINLANKLSVVFNKVLLIGKNQTQEIYNRLVELEFDKESVEVFSSLEGAKERFKTLLVTGDVVLLLNDLPDNYTEI